MSTSRLCLIVGATSLVALVLWITLDTAPTRAAGPICVGVNCYVLHTTAEDFVSGSFYATGLRKIGNGEVQLLPLGLTADWVSDAHPLPGPRASVATVTFNDVIYAIGGYDTSNVAHAEIFSATTDLAGNFTATWVTNTLPAVRAEAGAVISKTATGGILYVVGGSDGSGSPSNTIYYRTINSDGGMTGSWTTDTTHWPLAAASMAVAAHGGYLYIVGGGVPAATDVVYRLPINSDGSLETAIEEASYLPARLVNLSAVTWEGTSGAYLYVLGGNGTLGTDVSGSVYYTSFNSDGSLAAWQSTTLVQATTAHMSVQANGAIQVTGGRQGINSSTTVTKVETALIDPDGTLHNWGGSTGNWVVTSPLPEGRYSHGSVITLGGELYVIGGYNSAGIPQNTVFHGPTSGLASSYAANGYYVSTPFDVNYDNNEVSLDWHAIISDTDAMTLTMQYRMGNTTTELESQEWTNAGNSVESSTGATNTLSFAAGTQKRFLQYRALFTTTISSVSPALTAVKLNLLSTATLTPTPTVTPTVTSTPAYPDFSILSMSAPTPASGSSAPVTQTINVTVTNSGSVGFNKSARLSTSRSAVTGQRSTARNATRPKLSSLAGTRSYTGTTASFVWVDVYVDTIAPTTPVQLGNCATSGGSVNAAYILGLAGGEQTSVALDCWLRPDVAHRFYAQVDTCDDNTGTLCSVTYGYVLERDETNNIFGPYLVFNPDGALYFPFIGRY